MELCPCRQAQKALGEGQHGETATHKSKFIPTGFLVNGPQERTSGLQNQLGPSLARSSDKEAA